MSELETRVRAALQQDFSARKGLERRLARDPAIDTDAMADLLASPEASIRRVAIELLRRRAEEDAAAVEALLGHRSRERDIKARRRLAAALGEVRGPRVLGELHGWLGSEEHRFVQASIILALGEHGYDEWGPSWLARADGKGPVAEALRTVCVRSAGHVAVASRPFPPGQYVLHVYRGLEALAAREVAAGPGWTTTIVSPGWLSLPRLAEGVEDLARLALPLSVHLVLELPNGDDSMASAIAAAALGLGDGSTPRFRITSSEKIPIKRRRVLLRGWARAIESATGWRNDPSNYSLELLRADLERPMLLVRDMTWPTLRAKEQRATVDASMHPTVAAALCSLAVGEESPPEGATFVDPCAGAGTSLREWLRAYPATRALGFDRSKAAVRTAQANLKGLGDRAIVRLGDMNELPLDEGSVWAMVANLPFGIRSGRRSDNETAYAGALREAHRILRPGGRVVAYTHDRAHLRSAGGRQRWAAVDEVTVISAGGLDVPVTVFVR